MAEQEVADRVVEFVTSGEFTTQAEFRAYLDEKNRRIVERARDLRARVNRSQDGSQAKAGGGR